MKERELPEGWEWKRLGDLVDFFYGYPFDSSKFNDESRGYPVIRIRDLVKHSMKTFYEGEFDQSYLVDKDDILIGMDGEFNIVRWKGPRALLNQRNCKLTIKSDKILAGYLFRVLIKILKDIEDTTPFVTVKHLSAKHLNSIHLPLPPLSVQHQIVAVLEQAEAVKRQRQEADALTGALLQSVFYEMFGNPVRNERGWPLKNIKEFSTPGKNAIKAGPFGSSLKKECYTKTGFKIYGQEQVIKDDLQFGDYYISEEKYQELINYSVQAGDILISLVGSYGKISIVPESFEHGIINPRLMKISLNQEIVLPIFFKHLFLTEGILNQIEELSHGGTMDIINVGIVKQLKFPAPPLALQQQFARVVESVERINEQQVASGKEIKGLCEGLMARAFAGELVA